MNNFGGDNLTMKVMEEVEGISTRKVGFSKDTALTFIPQML
jgi:hypothetical protein